MFADICYSDSEIVKSLLKDRRKRFLKLDLNNLEQYFKKDVHLSRGQSMRYQAIDLQIYQFGRVPKQIFPFQHPKIRIKSMFNKKGILFENFYDFYNFLNFRSIRLRNALWRLDDFDFIIK